METFRRKGVKIKTSHRRGITAGSAMHGDSEEGMHDVADSQSSFALTTKEVDDIGICLCV